MTPNWNYISRVPAHRRMHGDPALVEERLASDLRGAVGGVNLKLQRVREVLSPSTLESKTVCALVHDLLVEQMCLRGCVEGLKNGKPDLLFYPEDQQFVHYWIEVKGSSRKPNGKPRLDWQAHPTKNQAPPPQGSIHLLLDIETRGEFCIKDAFLLKDAKYAPGKSLNSPFGRIDPASLQAMKSVFV